MRAEPPELSVPVWAWRRRSAALANRVGLLSAVALTTASLATATLARESSPALVSQSAPGDCVRRYGHTGCAAYHYAQVLCEIVGVSVDLNGVQARLHQRFAEERIDFRGIPAERVEMVAVRYYVPQICPERQRRIWGVFLPQEAG